MLEQDSGAGMGPVLVTGCAGMIGARVSELLLGGGRRVVGVDDMNDAYDVRLKEWRLGRIRPQPGFEFHRLDIRDREALGRLFREATQKSDRDGEGHLPFDGVINLAARAGVRQSLQDPWVYYETNVTGVLHLLDLCREYEVPKLVQASTSSLYGMGIGPDRRRGAGQYPFSETDGTDRPLSPYAASKKAAEALCHTYHYLYDIDVTALRYFTVYGPAGRPDMSLFRFVQWISEGKPVEVYGDGKQTRDFTFLDDVGRATIAALKPLGFEVINIGSDRPIVLSDAIEIVARAVGKEAIARHQARHAADVTATWADITKAERLLGWRPLVSFQDGVERLVEWYKENRDWARDIRTS